MGFFDKIKQGLAKTRDKLGGFVENVLSSFREVDEDLLEELEEALILSDVGGLPSHPVIFKVGQYAAEYRPVVVQGGLLASLGSEMPDVFVQFLEPRGVCALAHLLVSFRRRAQKGWGESE